MSDPRPFAEHVADESFTDRVDDLADRFEAAWRELAPPRIEAFLGEESGERREVLRSELEEIDRAYRARVARAAGETTAEAGATPAPEGSEPAVSRSEFPVVPGYEILGEIGRGGMGVVYRARQIGLKREVALKMIRTGDRPRPRELARFRAEAEAAARLTHPNIVQIYEVGDDADRPYLALEYVGGGSLAQRLDGTPMPVRPAAELVETLARAMHHAHQRGVVHRDLKPANILVKDNFTAKDAESAEGKQGKRANQFSPSSFSAFSAPSAVKITDFGLAKLLEADAGQTGSGEILGTPSYMAPEQAEGKRGTVGPAVDVYALGAILYELLTGRPPFQGETTLETLDQLRHQEPVAPRQLQPKLPRDVETICLKALARSPGRRYATAEALADDLRRFLDGRPIQARPVGRTEKAWRWSRRNPRVAGLAAAVALLMVTLTIVSGWAAVTANEREEEARGREEAARAREQEAIGRERDRTREALIQKIQLLRLSIHDNGWSDHAWELVRGVVAIHKDDKDFRLRHEAAATLQGLDAHTVQVWESDTRNTHDASAVAFSNDGKQLLLGGMDNRDGKPHLPARLWDRTTKEMHFSQQLGAGPLAFGSDGTPLQVVPCYTPPSVLVWDVAKQQKLAECRFADSPRDARLARNRLSLPIAALSPDGALVAAATTSADPSNGAVAVWHATTGRRLMQVAVEASALALALENQVLAVADTLGSIRFWLPLGGKELPVLREVSRLPIHVLTFSRNGQRLAVGDAGGSVTIWDWKNRRLLSVCRGSPFDVYALAFNPDGTLLTSGGRYAARLWDAATGHLLLNLDAGDFITGLVFSSDGKMLACSTKTGFGPARVSVWDLKLDRGIQVLHGLDSPVSKVCFSAEGDRLAALAQNWQVAIWNVATGHLQCVLDVPPGLVADNAALTFSPDGCRFAVAAGQEAKLWDLQTGKTLGTWKLPPGLCDTLAFHPSGRLLLVRAETEGGLAPPYGNDYRKHPRVCPIYELVAPNQLKRIEVIREFNQSVFNTRAAVDGGVFLIEGYHHDTHGEHRAIHAFDSRTGKNMWSVRSGKRLTTPCSTFPFDPARRLVGVELQENAEGGILVEAATGKLLGPLKPWPHCLGPGAKHLVADGPLRIRGLNPGLALLRRGEGIPLVVLGTDGSTSSESNMAFDRDGDSLARGNSDGTVTVYRLPVISDRLAEVGLGW